MAHKSDLSEIAATLVRVVRPDMTPKQLLQVARKAHPSASKKEVVRAAFYSLITNTQVEPKLAETLHDFAMTERKSDEEETATTTP